MILIVTTWKVLFCHQVKFWLQNSLLPHLYPITIYLPVHLLSLQFDELKQVLCRWGLIKAIVLDSENQIREAREENIFSNLKAVHNRMPLLGDFLKLG